MPNKMKGKFNQMKLVSSQITNSAFIEFMLHAQVERGKPGYHHCSPRICHEAVDDRRTYDYECILGKPTPCTNEELEW
jgi:hypothetical protein